MPVDKERAVRHIVGAQDQIHENGLPGAGPSHHTHALSRVNGKGYVLKRICLPVGITEGKAPELDLPLHVMQLRHILPVVYCNLCVQELTDTV